MLYRLPIDGYCDAQFESSVGNTWFEPSLVLPPLCLGDIRKRPSVGLIFLGLWGVERISQGTNLGLGLLSYPMLLRESIEGKGRCQATLVEWTQE
jgi:hypothetical protein